jgi:two-component system nitrate/nitrite response regulator NarL
LRAVIRIAVIADSPVHRAGLTSMLGEQPDVEIVAAVNHLGDGDDGPLEHALAVVHEADVTIVVPRRDASVDDELFPDQSDLDERHRGPAMVVLLERLEAGVAQAAYDAGARAVLELDVRAEELLAAVRAVAAGLVVVPSGVSAELLSGVRSVATGAGVAYVAAAPLTSREREVLALLAQGLANKVIAVRLGITEHTVKTHIAAVYEKLNARNRTEVLIAAARMGLVVL